MPFGLKHEKAKKLFPFNNSKRQLRSNEVYKVNFANTDRYKKSTIPFLQKANFALSELVELDKS